MKWNALEEEDADWAEEEAVSWVAGLPKWTPWIVAGLMLIFTFCVVVGSH